MCCSWWCAAVHETSIVVGAGDRVSWSARTTGKDIGFGVDFTPAARPPSAGAGALAAPAARRVLLPAARRDLYAAMESGSALCETAGTVRLVFDNSYSWFADKELRYRVDVLKADEAPRVESPTPPVLVAAGLSSVSSAAVRAAEGKSPPPPAALSAASAGAAAAASASPASTSPPPPSSFGPDDRTPSPVMVEPQSPVSPPLVSATPPPAAAAPTASK
jgi:hypothetical protein